MFLAEGAVHLPELAEERERRPREFDREVFVIRRQEVEERKRLLAPQAVRIGQFHNFNNTMNFSLKQCYEKFCLAAKVAFIPGDATMRLERQGEILSPWKLKE